MCRLPPKGSKIELWAQSGVSRLQFALFSYQTTTTTMKPLSVGIGRDLDIKNPIFIDTKNKTKI